jgi:CO/xanthine dehydrogenase FAD-binding subunit
MLHINTLRSVTSLAEAYETLVSVPGSVVLGGCGYLRLGARKIDTAIDLSRLGLDQVTMVENTVEIGAMTSLRTIETHPLASSLGNGVLCSALGHIVGVQFRNCVTIGGTVAGRYPFSDPITALVALDAKIQCYHQGVISLSAYLVSPGSKDIVEKIILPVDGRLAAFAGLRQSAVDFAVLNVAVARCGDGFRIVVGSRPGRAMRAGAAETYLNRNGLDSQTVAKAGQLAGDELSFGDNARASGDYRRTVCPVLIRWTLTEVLHAD